MTHFVCGVIIPKEEKENYENYLSSVLEPYSEYHEVDAHITITKKEVLKDYKRSKSTEDLREWAEDYLSILESYREDYICFVDCHI